MGTHSSILGLGNLMDREVWRATFQWGHKESDTTERLNKNNTKLLISYKIMFGCNREWLSAAPSTCPILWGFPGGLDSKESACNARGVGSIPEWGRSPWRREWQPTPVLLPRRSHGGRNLVGYSPWGRKESDVTERLHFHFQTICSHSVCSPSM